MQDDGALVASMRLKEELAAAVCRAGYEHVSTRWTAPENRLKSLMRACSWTRRSAVF